MLHYELKLAQYKGPIEELLGLIEERKLEINEISMAQVTDDFLRYLETITAEYRSADASPKEGVAYMRFLADFIVIASRLIFIKSKSLLPDAHLSAEDEAEIKDLEMRLLAYRQFKPAMRLLNELWRKGNRGMSRPYFLHIKGFLLRMSERGVAPAFFYPGAKLTTESLYASIAGVQAGMQTEIREEEMVREKIISLEEKVSEIVARMKDLKETSFSRLSGDGSRKEAIVAFLAILHLAREQFISLEQESANSDILIKTRINADSIAD
jgi:segregation and condensation protein A